KFERMLVECNRQRKKTLDETIREVVVSNNPEEAHRNLVAHRKKAAEVKGDFIKIEGRKHRAKVSKGKEPMLRCLIRIVNAQRHYWPLSDRSIHYEVLNDPPLRHSQKPGSRYRNDLKSYHDLTGLLTRARLAGQIPFAAIADPTRTVCKWEVHQGAGDFVEGE